MKKYLFSENFKEKIGASIVYIACIFIIVLLTGACAGQYKKQESSYVNKTGQASAKDKSKIGDISADQQITCHYEEITGSRFKRKICKTKAQWAADNEKKRKNADSFIHDVEQKSGLNAGSSSDAMGGQTIGPER